MARGLGKGLSALMSDNAPAMESAATDAPVQTLRIEALQAGKYQPRHDFNEENLHELADSIEKNGILQPLVVRSLGNGKYEIIAGERRFRAAKLAKLKEVPVVLKEYSDQQALEAAIIENVQRQDLNPMEEAEGYQRLLDEFKYTQEKLARAIGKSRSHIANLLRLLGLPEAVKKLVRDGALSMGHARALIGVTSPESLAKRVVEEGLNVRQTEGLAKGIEPNAVAASVEKPAAKTGGGSARSSNHRADARSNDDVMQLEEMLSSNLGLKVSIKTHGAQKGEVQISYESLAQLDEILRRLGGSI
jgi:ParB family chromosome partitioning protein